MNRDTPQSYCIKHGLKIYPVYQRRDFYEKGEVIYEEDNWYIEVNNNGKITKYTKSIAKGKRISGSVFKAPIKRTYQHYVDQLKNLKK